MAASITKTNEVYALPEIKDAAQLREQINLLKASVKKNEEELISNFRRMPQETLKAASDAFLPSFINNMIANGSWKILTSGAGLLINPFSKKFSFGKQILKAAKKIGVLALVKTAYNVWRNKKTDHPDSSKPVSLKTDKRITKPKPVKQ